MDPVANAALTSWALDGRVIAILLAALAIYVRGWLRGRQILRDERDYGRLAAFAGGLLAIFVATESPLDAFDTLYLSAHMTQHLLLMMVAPPLILVGRPLLPLLRGLPRKFVKDGLGPFLAWPGLRAVGGWLTKPPVSWAAFAGSTIFWHLPKFYELAVGSPVWHGAQHASFFWTGVLFWWPVIRPAPGRYWPRWTLIPYLLSSDIVNTAVSASFVFSGRVLYPSYEAVRATPMDALKDQTLAGLIMWVPGSVVYLVPAFVIAMSLLSRPRPRPAPVRVKIRRRTAKPPLVVRWKAPVWRRMAQFAMLLLAIAVMADGFRGPQVTPLNLAGVLPWIHWRALSVLALLVVGNLFCMVCPFTFVRDGARKVLPAKLRWPRALRTKWLAAALFVLYLWAYEAFGLWDSPWLTAWVIAGYFAAAVSIDGLFRGATFCKYVCPIGQFHFVASLVSPREVGVRSAAVCRSCRTHDCIRGNEQTRGCELYLFQPKKAGNLDCTFCLDCVKACPHENVSLVSIAPAQTLTIDPYRSSIGRLSRRSDLAALALVVVFGAFVNAAGMVGPVLMREHAWHTRLGAQMMPFVVACFVALGLVAAPAIAVALCGALNRLSGVRGNVFDVARRFAFALVPVGIAMWAAHLLYHLRTGLAAPAAAVQRVISHGTVTLPVTTIPDWLTSAQILLLDAGLLLTLYVCWSLAKQYAGHLRQAVGVVMPWAVVSVALYAAGVWILFQPMQMRGMLH